MAELKVSSAHLILNPAAGSAAEYLGGLTKTARECGIRVRAGADGEPIVFEAPLCFSVDPGALRVLVPEELPASRQVPPLEASWHAARRMRRWLRPATQKCGSDDPQAQ